MVAVNLICMSGRLDLVCQEKEEKGKVFGAGGGEEAIDCSKRGKLSGINTQGNLGGGESK